VIFVPAERSRNLVGVYSVGFIVAVDRTYAASQPLVVLDSVLRVINVVTFIRRVLCGGYTHSELREAA
jgi:hypothetical protein